MGAKITTKEFIERSRKIHNDKFCYNLVICNGIYKKIKIICKICNEIFSQIPNDHLNGAGCPICRRINARLTNEEFIIKSNIVHDNKYTYPDKYIKSRTKISINCPKHGLFLQVANNHMMGQGCPTCKKVTTEEFIIRSNITHNNKYTYPDKYVSIFVKISINCPKHGLFLQRPSDHMAGCGCPICSRHNFISKLETIWLDSLNIPIENRQIKLSLSNKKILVDAYVSETNTVYEFYGNYWHGNLKIFKPEFINTRTPFHKTMQELYDKTIERENIIKNAKYNLITIWESDWKNATKK